ncbi:MAG TPA: hypothetical protein VMG11_14415 [Steroidobacteraceae bacterium]|nr:hypothetical protein [Steroidobacteraceae bacterium]
MSHEYLGRCKRLAALLSVALGLLLIQPATAAGKDKAADRSGSGFQLNLSGSVSDSGPFHLCTAKYTVPAGNPLHVSRVGFVGSSTQAGNGPIGGQIFVGSALVGVLNPTPATPLNNPPYVVTFYSNQDSDVDVDGGAVLYILLQFAVQDQSLQCSIVIAGQFVSKSQS